MKILLYTFDMVPGVERLMPWKTLVEVCRNGHKSDNEIAIISAEQGEGEREYEGVTIYAIPRGLKHLREFIEKGGWDVLYYPVAVRDGLKDWSEMAGIKIRKIAYVPGGIYSLSASFTLLRECGLRSAIPYLMDALTPEKLLTKKLSHAGFETVICQSFFTSKRLRESGFNRVVSAIPGMNEEACSSRPYHDTKERFVLFTGSSNSIRGGAMAIKAFDSIADKLPDVRMVILVRQDGNCDRIAFEKAIASVRHKERFTICRNNLTPKQLISYFEKAEVILLPFIIVPSEIPLTFFEALRCGTPVITFDNGGTTEYLRQAVMTAKKRSVPSLAEAILKYCSDQRLRRYYQKNAIEIMKNHPSWAETARQWLSVL